jgi:hypothetical protein
VAWRSFRASRHRKWRSNASRSVTCAGSTVANVGDEDDGDRSPRSKWSCLGGSWWRDDAQDGSRGQGEDGGDRVTTCSSALWDVSMPILASLADMGTSCAGQCKPLFGRWLVPACSVE